MSQGELRPLVFMALKVLCYAKFKFPVFSKNNMRLSPGSELPGNGEKVDTKFNPSVRSNVQWRERALSDVTKGTHNNPSCEKSNEQRRFGGGDRMGR